MLFSSLQFILAFFFLFLLLYYLVPHKWKKQVLLLGSILFYCAGSIYSFGIYSASIIINFGFNKMLVRNREIDPQLPQNVLDNLLSKRKRRRASLMVLIVLWNVCLLGLFKYWSFFAHTVNTVAGIDYLPILDLKLPLGISFYTFQVLSYQIDCYRETVEKPASLLDFAVYMTMFPQLISGPIVRYTTIAERLESPGVNLNGLESGMKNFVLGLGLKVLLANQIGTLWNSIQISGAESISTPIAWLGAVAYSMQLYFDFWGYSVMAIGLGQMIGYKMPQNFKNPYIATSVSDFWRRWHITLGSWFREYVYFPLGGSRCSKRKMIRNLFLVWILTGLWHGAGWNFLIWGITLFTLIAMEKLFLGKVFQRLPILGHLYVMILMPVTWVVFAIQELPVLLQYLGRMAGYGSCNVAAANHQLLRYLGQYWWLLVLGVFFMTPIPINFFKEKNRKWYMMFVMFAIFWFSVYEIYVGKNNPFLYFGF